MPAMPSRSRISATSLSLRRSESVPLCTLREFDMIEVPIWPGITTEHLMCGAVGGVRAQHADRSPESIHARGVDDVRLIRLHQHRQKSAHPEIDAAPAN